jgi:hypothetical protein
MCSSSSCAAAVQRDTRQPRPTVARPEPWVRWAERPTADYPFGVVEVIAGREVAYYDVCALAGVAIDGCRGFHFRKHGGPEYHVLLAANPQDHSCECLGFLRHGNANPHGCRHIVAARFVAATPAPAVADTRPVPADCPF